MIVLLQTKGIQALNLVLNIADVFELVMWPSQD